MNRMSRNTLFFILGTLVKLVTSTTYTCSSNAPCGCSTNSAVLTKIVGGESAGSQTWGWAASLRRSSGSHFCGGSIISDSHILTAAHCTVDLASPSSVTVYVGSIYLSSATQIRSVSKIYVHPSYSSSTFLNDISILKLSSPLNLNQNGVDRICLPNISSTVLATTEYPRANVNLIAIGWGVLRQGSQSIPDTLQQVTIQSIAATNRYCQNVGITSVYSQMCAGVLPTGGKDTCQGDSGGPLLMFTSQSVWEQVGITSFGDGCAQANSPGVYTRVAAYQSWINATMNNANQVVPISYAILIPILLTNLL